MVNLKQDINIAVLQEKVTNIEDELYKIRDNELPHIKEDLGKIKIHLGFYAGALATLQFLFKFFFN